MGGNSRPADSDTITAGIINTKGVNVNIRILRGAIVERKSEFQVSSFRLTFGVSDKLGILQNGAFTRRNNHGRNNLIVMANNSKRSGSFIKGERETRGKFAGVVNVEDFVRGGNKVRSRVLSHIQTAVKRGLKSVVRNLTDKVRRAKRELVVNIDPEKVALLGRNKPLSSHLKSTGLILYKKVVSVIRPDSPSSNNEFAGTVLTDKVQAVSRAERISGSIGSTVRTSRNQVPAVCGNNPDKGVHIVAENALVEGNLPLIGNIKKVVSGIIRKVTAAGIQPTVGTEDNGIVGILGEKRRGQTKMQKVFLRQDYLIINRGNMENVRVRVGEDIIAASVKAPIGTFTRIVPFIH